MTGLTTENRQVIKGIFKMYSTDLGLPLADIIDVLWSQDMVVDWEDFYIEARKSGMSKENVHRLIKGGFLDSLSCREGVESVEEFFRDV